MLPDRLSDPLGWRKPSRVFVNSMSDLFHEDVPFEYIVQVFGIMMISPRHTYQILTKRPQRMREFFEWFETYWPKLPHVYKLRAGQSDAFFGRNASLARTHSNRVDREPFYGADHTPWPLKNVWLGVSVENQAAADERIPLLCKTPAAIRFLSCEPLLGPIDFTPADWRGTNVNADHWLQSIDWVIVGGESGKRARPMHRDWARAIRDDCRNRDDMGRPWPLPFHFKQWGEWISDDLADEMFYLTGKFATTDHCGITYHRVGTKRAGRELDGRTWDGFPAVRV
jgi:protein gp37